MKAAKKIRAQWDGVDWRLSYTEWRKLCRIVRAAKAVVERPSTGFMSGGMVDAIEALAATLRAAGEYDETPHRIKELRAGRRL